MLLIDVLLAVVGGWTVVETGGIGAAVLGHAITRFAIFILTGHTDQSRPFSAEPEAVAGRALPPKGWDLAGRTEGTRPWTTHLVGAGMGYPANVPSSGPTYAGESPFAGQGYQQAVPMGPQAPMGPQPGYPPGPGYPDPNGYGPGGEPPEGHGPWPPQEPWMEPGPGGYVPAEGMPPPPPDHVEGQGGGPRG